MDNKFSIGDIFKRGRTFPSDWRVIRIKLIFDVIHYELEDTKSPKRVMLSEWALIKDKNWTLIKT